MEDLSKKATIILEVLKRLEAVDEEHKTNIYVILEKLDNIDLKEILPEEEEYELDCIACEMSQKSVSTTLASLVRKGYVKKTEVSKTQVGSEMKNIRSYYLVNRD